MKYKTTNIMNREILFEYGFESVNGIIKKHYFLHEIPNIATLCDVWSVLPIVYVRQWTGLTDKNGTRIFEGKGVLNFILHGIGEGVVDVIMHEGSWCIYEKSQGYANLKEMLCNTDTCSIEVIGNIHQK